MINIKKAKRFNCPKCGLVAALTYEKKSTICYDGLEVKFMKKQLECSICHRIYLTNEFIDYNIEQFTTEYKKLKELKNE